MFERRIGARWALLLLAALTATACDDDDPADPPEPVTWEATLAGVGANDDLEGTATVEATSTRFIAEIAIEGGVANDEFKWTVARGTCGTPGAVIGAASSYPDLEVGANGTAAAEATVNVRLDEDDDYIVRVIDVGGSAPVTAACGALGVE
jgi:hypothetical protein